MDEDKANILGCQLLETCKESVSYPLARHVTEKKVLALIAAGADVNRTDDQGKTALFYAVQQNVNESMVHALVDGGADVNRIDNEGKTALYYAITKSDLLTTYLLDRDANLYLEDNYSVLTFLFERLYEIPFEIQERIQILIDMEKVTKQQILKSILSVVFIKFLSFNPNSYDFKRDPLQALLRVAKDLGHRKSIEKISQRVKGKSIRALFQQDTIHMFLYKLVEVGANPNCVDSDGNSALHHATQLSWRGVSQENVLYICDQLKTMRASLHLKNHNNETPLVHCLAITTKKISNSECCQRSFKTQFAVCQFLVENACSNAEEKVQTGDSALRLTLELLRQTLSDRVCKKRYLNDLIRLVRDFLTSYEKIGIPAAVNEDDSGNTLLHLWAKLELPSGENYSSTISKGHTFRGLLKMILDHLKGNKSLLHVKNENGATPLHLCRTWTAVELLLDAGANPNDVDSSGRTPLLNTARECKSLKRRNSLYPDISLSPDKFWSTLLKSGFDTWSADKHGESLFSVLMESESHDLATSLINVACEDIKVQSCPLILFSLLTAICRDKLPDAQWKKDAAEIILSSTRCPVNGNDKEDSPLHYCCRNILHAKKTSSIDEIKNTVHWNMVKLLRSYGADYGIPDAREQSCLDIAEEFPELKDLLMEPIDIEGLPVLIDRWKSVSKTHERCLAEVARHRESEQVESYCYHTNPLASGSFGAVFAGINEKDGREVAIKRIEKMRMKRPEDKREIMSLTALADCEQVVSYLCFLEDKYFAYIVLELMEGDLEELFNTAITMKKREELCHDVVKGLSYVHSQGYLHRDLKPANILFKTFPKLCLKIVVFGLCRHDDNTQLSTMYGTNAETRTWIAPEVLTATKDQHSQASDMFSCGLVLHYILSGKKHPFSPEDCVNKSEFQICHETETNAISGKKVGWDDSLSPEATNLLEQLLEGDATKRPTAAQSAAHPLFWPKTKKVDLLIAVGNQPEFEYPRAGRPVVLSAFETDLEAQFGTIVKYAEWDDPGYAHMPDIYKEMKKWRTYDTRSVVELVRLIRNGYAHVSEGTRPTPFRKHLLEDFVFLKHFPHLVMEVYKAVTTHGWDQTREEIKNAMKK